MTSRDEFSLKQKDALGRRVHFHCSNPDCGRWTIGPHEEVDKSVNIGVAAHITAAAVGGPRFDAALSPEERKGIENGIWLCQNCAKLIDSDEVRFPVDLLRTWRSLAEDRARAELEGFSAANAGQDGSGIRHAPVPKIYGQIYDEARKLLISSGWQPLLRHWQFGGSPDMSHGNGLAFWERGYREIEAASGTGLGHCLFSFADVYGNVLKVVTAGVEDDEEGYHALVCRWFFKCDSPPT